MTKREEILDYGMTLPDVYIRWEMTPASIGGERQFYISGGSQSPI